MSDVPIPNPSYRWIVSWPESGVYYRDHRYTDRVEATRVSVVCDASWYNGSLSIIPRVPHEGVSLIQARMATVEDARILMQRLGISLLSIEQGETMTP